jgi:hypothetical protein
MSIDNIIIDTYNEVMDIVKNIEIIFEKFVEFNIHGLMYYDYSMAIDMIKKIYIGINKIDKKNKAVFQLIKLETFIDHIEFIVKMVNKFRKMQSGQSTIISLIDKNIAPIFELYNKIKLQFFSLKVSFFSDVKVALKKFVKENAKELLADEKIFNTNSIISSYILNYLRDELPQKKYDAFAKNMTEKVIYEDNYNTNRKLYAPINNLKYLILSSSFLPQSVYMDLNELTSKYFPAIGKFTNLTNLSKSISRLRNKKVAIMEIKNIYKSPKLFNFEALTDQKYINQKKYDTRDIIGINNKIIERFNTIQPINTKIKVYKDNIEFYYGGELNLKKMFTKGKRGADVYLFIIETQNNVSYRVLGHDLNILIHFDVIMDIRTNTKIDSYNYILQNEILNHLQYSRLSNTLAINEERNKIQAGKILSYTKEKLYNIWDKLTINITNEKELYSLIKSGVFGQYLLKFVPGFLSLFSENELQLIMEKNLKSEIILSFISKLIPMSRKFNIFILSNYKNNFGKKYKETKLTFSIKNEIKESIIPSSLSGIFSTKANIYSQFLYKIDIMAATISQL